MGASAPPLTDWLTGLATLALAFFGAVQLWEGRQERRDRKRAAYGALWADYLRVASLASSLAEEDLVQWVWERAIVPEDLLPRDWGTVVRLLGEIGPGTAALGATAYQTLTESAIRLRMLISSLERLRELVAAPPEAEVYRKLEAQVKNGLKVAAEVLDDAMRQPPRWLRQKKGIRIRDPHSEIGRELQRQLAGELGESEAGQMTDPAARPWNEEEWLRTQYKMAHHDIWWVKSQQMRVGNWTLLLVAGLVGVAKLMHDLSGFTPTARQGFLLGLLGALVTVLGVLYVWDLYFALLDSRKRASIIVQKLTHSVFESVKGPTKRNRRDVVFPVAITLVLLIALRLVLWYFHAQWLLDGETVFEIGSLLLVLAYVGWRALRP